MTKFKENKIRNVLLSFCFVFVVVSAATLAQENKPANVSQGGDMSMSQHWNELFQQSQKEKKGLTFFIKGQTVPGIVTNVIGNEAVEVKNQTFSRIIIRLESVDAIAIN